MKKTKWLIMLIMSAIMTFAVGLFCACGDVEGIVDSVIGGNGNNGGGTQTTPVVLTAPTGIKYDGATITWNAVTGAQKYSVRINEGEAMSTAATAFAYRNSANTAFTVTVTAKADGSEDSPAGAHQFIPLEKISTVNVSQSGELSWEAVEFATGYLVSVDNKESEIYTTTFSDFETGSHTFKVKPVTNLESDTASYYAAWSDSKTLNILGDVDKSKITYSLERSLLTWAAVPGAAGYHVTISGVTLPVDTTVNTTSLSYTAELGNFAVTVQTLGNGSTTFDGRGTVDKTFVYLETARNLRIVNGALLWDEVSGAEGYKVKVGTVENQQVFTECKFEGNFQANRPYTVSVMPVSGDTVYYTTWSTDFSFSILPAPVLRWVDNAADGEVMNNVVWDGISNAANYEVLLKMGDSTETFTYGESIRSFGNAYTEVGSYEVTIKALAPENSSNVYDSAYSDPLKVIRLDAPEFTSTGHITSQQNNMQNGFTVTFLPVSGASGYRIWKDGVEYATTKTTQYHESNVVNLSVLEEQNFTYKIQSIGRAQSQANKITTVVLDSLSSTARSFNIKVLPVPTGQDLSGYQYTYNAVSGAFGYMVNVDNRPAVNDDLSYDLSALTAGNHTVSVCSRGNGAEILSSNYTPAINIRRLATPVDVEIGVAEASDGVLSYSPVEGAVSYTVVFDGGERTVPVNELGNMKQYITEQGTTLYMQAVANIFNAEHTLYTMTSLPGVTYNFIKLSKPTFGEVAFSGAQLVWNAPGNILTSQFTPTYEVYNNQDEVLNGEKNGTSMSTNHLEGGKTYTFTVKAIGDGKAYINSEKSDPVSAFKLRSPDVKTGDGCYEWNSVVSAVSYAVYIDGVLSSTEYHEAGGKYTFVPGFDRIKTYNVQVYAIGDIGRSIIDSAPCEIRQQTKLLATPDFTFNYTKDCYAEDGEVVITITQPSPYARGYNYSVGGSEKVEMAETYSFNTHNVGSFALRVYACGGNFDDEGIYYLNSQSCGGNARYTINILTSPNLENTKISADGKIDWTDIPNARAYEVTCVIDGVTYETKTVGNASFVIGDQLGVDYSTVHSVTVTIQAIGDGTKNYVKSKPTEKTWTVHFD